MADRVEKDWQAKGLAGYPTEALLGTLAHYGVNVDEAAFRKVAEGKFPIAIGAHWAESWKGTGKFKDFPFPAADELWRRWLKDVLAPNELVLSLLELLRSVGSLTGVGPEQTQPAAFAAAEAMVARLPKDAARVRFMAEVVALLGKFQGTFDTAAEQLARKKQDEAALRFVALEEALFPMRAGVSRAIVEATLGKGPTAIDTLEAMANDNIRAELARISAVDALMHLGEVKRAAPALFALMEAAKAKHDHELAHATAQRAQALVKSLPKGSLQDEAIVRTRVLIDAFDHAH